MTKPSWDEFALAHAAAASIRGDCTRRRVGAAFMTRDHRIIGTGYNGAPAGAPGCLLDGACPRGAFTHTEIPPNLGNEGHPIPCIAKHAEHNTLELVTEDLEYWEVMNLMTEATLAISEPGGPCAKCREMIVNNYYPLNRVIWPGGEWIPWQPLHARQ